MFSIKSIVLIAVAFAIGAESSAVPAFAAAPLVAPAHVGYAHAVPQNIPPYASQVNVVNKALNPIIGAPAVAAPLAAAPVAAPFGAPLAAPLAAPYATAPFAAAPYAAAPYFAGPAPYAYPAPAAYAAPATYAAPFPYSAPLLRTPFGFAPTFVR